MENCSDRDPPPGLMRRKSTPPPSPTSTSATSEDIIYTDGVQESNLTPPTPISQAATEEPALPSIFDSDDLLTKDHEEIMTSKLLEPVKINFNQPAEQDRQKRRHKIVPSSFWRTAYETSITLSEYTSKDTHAKHREQPHLRIRKGNAFQALAVFNFIQDMVRERIERHLIWNKKIDPSCYISTFNSKGSAIKRADFHYEESQRIGQRVFITEIMSGGLVAATVSARCVTTVKIITKRKDRRDLPDIIETKDFEFDIDIPIWIRDPRKPEDRADLTLEEFEKLQADIWISIKELRSSNLDNGPKSRLPRARARNMICAKGHNYEWLTCTSIPISRIVRVMPFDGKVLYEYPTTKIIRSLKSTEPWVWSWHKLKWVLDAALTSIAEMRDMEAHRARKRKAGLEFDEAQDPTPKRPKMIEVALVRPYFDFFSSDNRKISAA